MSAAGRLRSSRGSIVRSSTWRAAAGCPTLRSAAYASPTSASPVCGRMCESASASPNVAGVAAFRSGGTRVRWRSCRVAFERVAQGGRDTDAFICSVQAHLHGQSLQRHALRCRFLTACKVLGPERVRMLNHPPRPAYIHQPGPRGRAYVGRGAGRRRPQQRARDQRLPACGSRRYGERRRAVHLSRRIVLPFL